MPAGKIEAGIRALLPPGNAGSRGKVCGVPVRRFAAHYEVGRGRRAFDVATAVQCVEAELSRPKTGEYVAIDLDENNGKPAGTFGWGICRHGHGLQDFPRLSEHEARYLAAMLTEEAV